MILLVSLLSTITLFYAFLNKDLVSRFFSKYMKLQQVKVSSNTSKTPDMENTFDEGLYQRINAMFETHMSSSDWNISDNMRLLNYISQVELFHSGKNANSRYHRGFNFMKRMLIERSLRN